MLNYISPFFLPEVFSQWNGRIIFAFANTWTVSTAISVLTRSQKMPKPFMLQCVSLYSTTNGEDWYESDTSKRYYPKEQEQRRS